MKGLEITELSFKGVINHDESLRIESEFFKKKFLQIEDQIREKPFFVLNDVKEKITDGTHYTPSYVDSGVPFLSALNVKENFLDTNDNFKFITLKEHRELYRRCNPKSGDVLLRKVGVGARHACVVPQDIFEFSLFVSVALIRCKDINPFYLSTFINSKYGQSQLIRFNKGISQPDLHLEEIAKLKIPKLSDGFQKLIENLVGHSNFLVKESLRIYYQAEQILLQTLGLTDLLKLSSKSDQITISEKSFQESFGISGRLDAEYYQPKFENLEYIVRKNALNIMTIGEIQTFNARGLQPVYVDGGKLAIINSKHILENTLDYDNFEQTSQEYWNIQERARVFKNDILTYTTGANIGRTQVYTASKEALASNHVNILRIRDYNQIYVAFVMNSVIGRYQTEKLSAGSAQQELYPKDIEGFYIPFIDYENQRLISNKVEESNILRNRSTALLEAVKRAVEIAIETSEEAGSKWLDKTKNQI